jgi:hypothetical protein
VVGEVVLEVALPTPHGLWWVARTSTGAASRMEPGPAGATGPTDPGVD